MASSDRQAQPVSILFVCLGNICRSTMAEGVFRHITHFGTSKQHPLIKNIDSCGTGAYHAGDSPDSRTMAVLKKNGLTDYKHSARRIRVPEDFACFDYILAMDGSNLSDLKRMETNAQKRGQLNGGPLGRICMFGEFGGQSKREEIDDPYYGGKDGFEDAYEQVTRFGQGLLRHIEEQAKGEAGDVPTANGSPAL